MNTHTYNKDSLQSRNTIVIACEEKICNLINEFCTDHYFENWDENHVPLFWRSLGDNPAKAIIKYTEQVVHDLKVVGLLEEDNTAFNYFIRYLNNLITDRQNQK